ncbi:short-chain dehydrogenase [Mycolicibacterium sp. (ex Dasyatis americana)]|uniref:SDR family oxidoreductase n=1 Tax=Mycolicibacterium porcinum TaxID=39693 RepID=UPI000872C209|nr:SDR family oxidoreductase [Mycolicibacterium porcinum]OFB37372.1 short-chain dehydrogenase [Mycolicibacterium sp. (ex Dasyatis americana)]TVY00853.1 SDR family oxidoreductase [Mycolicibacterium porcinum]
MELTVIGRTYLVTGGGSGIGKGVAARLAEAGGNVMLVGRNPDKLAKAVPEVATRAPGGEAAVRTHAADVTDEEQVAGAVTAAAGWTGRLDGVVHCAGGTETIGPLTQIDSQAWRNTVDLNVNGTMYLIKHAGREMVRAGGGAFVGISSIAASNTHRWFGAYGVSKTALDHLLQLAADELGPSWVRVNGIRPGLTRTEMVAPVLELEPLAHDYRISTPLPRVGEVDDIANLALFLVSDAAGWITGQLINVDGGQMLRRGPDYSSMVGPMFGEDALRGVVS